MIRIVIAIALLFTPAWALADEEFTIILVRHAEKEVGSDPVLTDLGKRRADYIASELADEPLEAVWSSDTNRTRMTAEPTTAALGLQLQIYDPRQLEQISALLQVNKQTALVVGHSNTTPQLASLLCDCYVEPMDESEYNRVLWITFFENGTSKMNTTRTMVR